MATRISDLPLQNQTVVQHPNMDTRTSLMHSHPNPYGLQPSFAGQDESWLKSRDPREEPTTTQPEIQGIVQQYPVQQMPSKDIQQTTTHYTHDIETTPNYIPAPKVTTDFVREYERQQDKLEDPKYKHRQNMLDILIEKFKIPAIVAILYFLFQASFIKRVLFKYASFLYAIDGEYSLYGRIFVSSLFGLTYKGVLYIIDILAEPIS